MAEKTPLEQPVLAGTDGFRDTATTEPGPGLMNEETIAGLSFALVSHQLDQGLSGPVIIAQDTRPSGNSLRRAAIDGALAAGAPVINLDILPTPGAQRAARELGALATIVLTASHNDYPDNGWKGMIGFQKPSPDTARTISDRYWQQVQSGFVVPRGRDPHSYESRPEYAAEYTDSIVTDITKTFGETPLRDKIFVIDGANGAAMHITPEVFERLGAQVVKFNCDPSKLINDGCGAANLDGLKDFLLARPDLTSDPRFVGAVANDGDADRFMGVGMQDGRPVEITGNHVMEAFALYPKEPRQAGIIGTLYTNSAMSRRLQAEGIGFEHCDNGDAFVTQALLAKQALGQDWTRGGEFTGHIIDTDWLSSGDGVRSAAWFAAWAVSQKQASFGEIARDMPMQPEKMLKIRAKGSYEGDVAASDSVQQALDAERQIAGRDIRFVVRASGTEKGVVRVWAEGRSEELVSVAVERIGDAVLHAYANG